MSQNPSPSAGTSEQAELMALLAPKQKRKLPIVLAAAAALALVGGGVWSYLSSQSRQTSAQGMSYRQYTVQRGDVVVGSSESSSISLEREFITFPVSATVEEVFVKAGSSVQEGDPLMRLNTEEIQAGMVSYELQLQMAQLELQQATLDQQTKLLKAKQTYDSAILEGELAETSQSLSVQQLEKQLADAEEALKDALERLDTYQEYEDSYEDDADDLSYYTKKYKAYKSDYDALQADYKRAQELTDTLIPGAQSNYDRENADDPDSNAAAYWLEQLTNYQGELDQIYADADCSDLTELDKLCDNAYDNYINWYNKYQDFYTDFYDTYDDLYFDDEDALNDKIEELREKVDSYSLALEQAKVSQQTGSLSAAQKQELTALSAQTAEAQYNLTVLQLSQSLDEKQEIYDQTLRQINEIKASLSDDGIVYAPCRGMVMNVLLDEGDSFDVTYDEDTDTLHEQTLLTMTDISSVYVPITISEEDILNVSIGQPATVTMNAFEGRSFDAEVDSMSVESSRSGAATVSYTVNVRYLGTNTLDMLEGMSAEVTLVQRIASDVLYINNQAVTNTDGVSTVQKLVNGEAVTTEVVTGFSNGQYVEIISGLSQGDVVLAASGVSRS